MTDLERLVETLKRHKETMELQIRDGKIYGRKWHYWFEFNGKGKAIDFGVSRLDEGFDESLKRFEEDLKEQSV